MLTQNHLTREQARVNEFLQQSQPLRDLSAQVTGTGLKQLTGNTVEALSFFIESELHYRQAERYQALKLHADRAKSETMSGAAFMSCPRVWRKWSWRDRSIREFR